MADRPEDGPEQPPPRKGKRPAPIIDLKAAEVPADPAPAPRAEAPAADAPARPEPEAAPPPPPPEPRPEARPAGVLPPFAWGAAGGFAAGAIVAGLVLAFAGSDESDLADATARLQAVDLRLTRLEQRPAPPAAARPEELAALARRLAEQERALGERIAALEARPAGPAGASAPNGERLAALEAAVKAATETAAQAARAAADAGERARAAEAAPRLAPDAIGPVTDAIRAVQERIGAVPELDRRIQALENRLGATGPGRIAGWPVALGALRAALDDGRPFARELSAARALAGPAEPKLAALAPFADRGLPTTAMLTEQFGRLVPELMKATPRGEPQGFLDRLARNAEGLVRVRPTGEGGGEDTAALVGRTEARLKQGDLAGALEVAERWPAEVKAAGRAWLAAATARHDAERLIDDLSADALAVLGGTRG